MKRILLNVSLLFLSVAIIWAIFTLYARTKAERAEGTVVSEGAGPCTDGSVGCYRVEVEYGWSGVNRRATITSDHNDNHYDVGQKVPLLLRSSNPGGAQIDDRTFLLVPMRFALLAFLFFAAQKALGLFGVGNSSTRNIGSNPQQPGTEINPIGSADLREILSLSQSDPIGAINLIRDKNGMGIVDAKNLFDQLHGHNFDSLKDSAGNNFFSQTSTMSTNSFSMRTNSGSITSEMPGIVGLKKLLEKSPYPDRDLQEICALILKHDATEAINRIRDKTNLGLRESKDAYDTIVNDSAFKKTS